MRLVLIGGGSVGRGNKPYETKEIDEEIVKLAKKENPTLLFIGLASNYSDSYYDTIKKIYKNLNCKTEYLKKSNLLNNRDIVENKINKADIIYIAGGDTIKLLKDIDKYNIENLLKNAIKRNCVIAGKSAGAIILSKEGYSDAYILRGEATKHRFIKGLGYCNLVISPHYEKESEKTKELLEEIQNTSKEVYCIENRAALIIEDNKIRVINSKEDRTVYKITYKDELIIEDIKDR